MLNSSIFVWLKHNSCRLSLIKIASSVFSFHTTFVSKSSHRYQTNSFCCYFDPFKSSLDGKSIILKMRAHHLLTASIWRAFSSSPGSSTWKPIVRWWFLLARQGHVCQQTAANDFRCKSIHPLTCCWPCWVCWVVCWFAELVAAAAAAACCWKRLAG